MSELFNYLGEDPRDVSFSMRVDGNRAGGLRIVYPEPTSTRPVDLMEASDSLAGQPDGDHEGRSAIEPLFAKNWSNRDSAVQSITPETDKKPDPRAKANEFIDTKAAEFYGTRVLAATPMYRLRIMKKALERMPSLDERTQGWVSNFDVSNATKIGQMAIHRRIVIPEPPHPTSVESGKLVFSEWTTREVESLHAYRYPKVREAVIGDLTSRGDSAAYVIQRLENWRKVQIEQPQEAELVGSQRCFEAVLFGIHGDTLPQYLETLIRSRFDEFDIPMPHAIA